MLRNFNPVVGDPVSNWLISGEVLCLFVWVVRASSGHRTCLVKPRTSEDSRPQDHFAAG
jgi:hypothetical protein